MSKYRVTSRPYFAIFRLNTEIYSVNLRIQSEYRKIRRNNSAFGHFHAKHEATIYKDRDSRCMTTEIKKPFCQKNKLYSHINKIFFLSGFSFTNIHDSQASRGRGGTISVTPPYHFHLPKRFMQRAHLCT